MYKVDYYTLAKCKNGEVGNVFQYSDTWYTDQEISVLETELQRVIDIRKGDGKYKPVITNIERIKGHLSHGFRILRIEHLDQRHVHVTVLTSKIRT